MKKLLWLSLALLLLSASPVFGATPEELLRIPVMQTKTLTCPSAPVATFENSEVMLRILFHPKTDLIIILDFKEMRAYLGKIVMVDGAPKYEAREALSISEVKERYPSACLYLEQKEA